MAEQHLEGLKIVLTGDFKSYTRREATRVLEDLGADVTGAVSGKTKIIIAGKSPGSKLQKGKARGLPILDEAQMLLLIGGKTLEEVLSESVEEERPKTPMPEALGFPKDGEFEAFFPGTDQLQISGAFVSGLRHGSWKEFWPNGQMKQDYGWEAGLKDGPELDWTDDGTQVCDGVNVAGKRKGTWIWWHHNAEYSHAFHHDDDGERTGDYKWDLADGSKRARGGYWHGKRHGRWEWWQEPKYSRVLREHHRGRNSGESKAWFHNDQLAYDTPYDVAGYQHGEGISFYEDGSPKTKGEFYSGVKRGIHSTWDEKGKKTDVIYREGIPEKVLSEKKIASIVKKLTKSKDKYGKLDALERLVDWSGQCALVLYLWREGHYDLPKDPELWETLKESVRLLSGDDIVRFLQNAAQPSYVNQLPGWNSIIDELVMRVYLRDPDPIDAAWEKFPSHSKAGVALVRARFGKDPDAILKERIASIAEQHAEHYGLSDNILWPDGNGALETRKLFDAHKEPTPQFDTFLSFFGSQENWVSALKERMGSHSEYGRLSFRTFHDVIKSATIEEMIKYCDVISLNALTIDDLTRMLLVTRNDTGEAITKIALEMKETGLRNWPVVCAAITRLAEEGNEIPQALLQRFELSNESPTYTSSWKTECKGLRLNQLPEELNNNFHVIADFLKLEPGFTSPTRQLVRDTLSKLTEEQRLFVFEKHLAEEQDYKKLLVVPFLYLVDSPEIWARAFEIAIAEKKPLRETITWGFGELGLRFLPTLLKHMKSEKRKTFKAPWQQGVICALLRATVDGEVFDEEYDSHIQFGITDPFLIEHLLYRLPTDRVERILLNTSDPKYVSSVFKLITLRPNETSLKHAFNLLLAGDVTLSYSDQASISMGFANLPNGKDWLRWLLENGATNNVYRQAIDYKVFDALEAELKEGGKEIAKPLDKIDKLLIAAAESSGNKEKIYALRRLEDIDAKTDLNILGGPAPGVGLDRWPFFQGDKEEPMEHLYTIDLATIPELQARYKDRRTLSVFCYRPENNEAYTVDSGWTEIIFSSQKEIDAGSEVPEDLQTDIEARFEVISIDVNLQDKEIRNQVYSLNARVLGSEIWLQGEDYWGDFVMQFDEGFCYMNLGDCGLMYVYSDGAFWQCH